MHRTSDTPLPTAGVAIAMVSSMIAPFKGGWVRAGYGLTLMPEKTDVEPTWLSIRSVKVT